MSNRPGVWPKAGCQIVRVTVPTPADAAVVAAIKEAVDIPVVADIHFDYKAALAALDAGADKIRINPGNIGADDRGHTLLAQRILDCQRVHDRGQHADLVGIHAVHFAAGAAAPEVAAADHNADLHAQIMRLFDPGADRSNDGFIKTGPFFPGQRFAAELQQHAFISNIHFIHHLTDLI